MTTTATRLITLIMLLQDRPNQKAADLANKLGVSVRTFHRYIGMLDEMGIPVYTERGPYGGFSLVRGYKLPPLVFTPEEAVAIYLGTSLVGQMWGKLYQEPAQGALAKLNNVLPDEQRGEVAWAQRALVTRDLHQSDPTTFSPLLEKLRRAARQHRQVRMRYQGSTSVDPTERRVNPYALVFRSGWWYLVGFCQLRQALRTFRVDRIHKLELLSEPFQMPGDFDVHAYLDAMFKDQPQIRAHLRFIPEAAHIARSNLTGWESCDENPDGSVDVVMLASDLNWLASLVLSFSTWVTVLEPPELRALVREWALATAYLYEDSQQENSKKLSSYSST
jgi:predicted DNA-binding transcriptional regulator YafY